MSNFINPTTTPIRSNTAAAPIGAAPLAATPGAPLMSGATTPILSNTAAGPIGASPLGAAPLGASPLGAAPLGGTTATTMLPATGTGLLGHHDNRNLSKQERKALKHQNKALKHDHGHHQHGHGLTGTGLPLAGGAATGAGLGTVMHGATNVVEHQPIVEREVIVERPVEVRREHHIQPVIHEREHQIQPVVRTEVTTERRDVVTDRNVMMPAVVEQPRLASTGLTTADQRGVMPGVGTTGMTGAHHATIGQKIKGTVKEVQGTLTHNPMKKEEGRLLKQGIEPTTTAGMGTTPGMMGTTGTATPGTLGNTTRI